MDRRELLKMIAVLTGGTVIGGGAFLNGCKNPSTGSWAEWSEADLSLLDEVADTILPATASSPGAKAVNIGRFMNKMVNDCYEDKDQQAFAAGIIRINEDCKANTGKLFIDCSSLERHDFLVALEKGSKEFDRQTIEKEKAEKEKNKDFKGLHRHYFTYIKQLTLLGYFTSETGCTKALRYVAVPGRYEGDVPYTRGEKAWA